MSESRVQGSANPVLRERVQAALAGRYLLGAEIGHGASAIVIAARDVGHFDRDVAIKVIRPEVAESVGVARFRREMQLVAQLNHPHILPLLDWGDADGLLYYAMPLVHGESLRARLKREQQLPLDDAVRITRDIAAALQHAHTHGVVHRDVKPENILLVEGEASLTDFGLARADERVQGESVTASGIAVGTAAYMSPEQASGGAGDARSDQYSLACVLYEMLAGDPPFHASSVQAMLARHRSDTPAHLTSVRPSLPAGIDEAVLRALGKVPADRFSSVTGFAQGVEAALTSGTLAAVRARTTLPHTEIRKERAVRWRGAALGGLAVAAAVWWVVTSFDVLPGDRSPPLDQNRLAVAPFDVFDPADSLWRDGLVDILSRQLDGAGPLRTVPATTVIKGWSGRADTRSGMALARRTGAGLILFGQFIRIRQDSARLAVTLFNAAAGRTVGDIEARDDASSIDRLVDSVTLGVLRELGRTQPIAALRRASLGSRSLPALKAFLQGEQLYRRNDFRSATEYYERALRLDSTFVLTLHRLRNVRTAASSEFDSLARWYGARAGELNHGLPPRDSLVILADSLAATFVSNSVVATDAWLARLRRRFATLDEATLRYPDDAELWRELGEARLHFGERVGLTLRDALIAFRRAIDLDPRFGPPYFHAVELSAAIWGADSAAALAKAYRSLNPADRRFAIVEQVLTTQGRHLPPLQPGTWEVIEPRAEAAYMLRRWADSAESSIAILRELTSAGYGDQLVFGDKVRTWLLAILLYRGHVDEAQQRATDEDYRVIPWHLAHAATVRQSSVEHGAGTFVDWAAGDALRETILTLPWFFARGDSASLLAISARLESKLRQPRSGTDSVTATLSRYGVATVRAYMALIRGDSAGAARYFDQRPDSLCPWWCAMDRVHHARLVRARSGARLAARILDRRPPAGMPITAAELAWQLERARIATAARESVYASALRGVVARVWKSADPSIRLLLAHQ